MIFFEPKALYRAAVGDVPIGDYTLPLGKAEIMRKGSDITIVGWGAQLRVLENACDMAEDLGISCELIDLRTIMPWDYDCVTQSVIKTGRLLISHEAPVSCGCALRVLACSSVTICSGTENVRLCCRDLVHNPRALLSEPRGKENKAAIAYAGRSLTTAFFILKAPISRVCGYDTPFPLVFEKYYVPDALKNFEAIKETVHF